MSVNDLTLPPGPQAAAIARRWVDEVLDSVGRSDLVDSAELAISELVTNAFVHGAHPISLHLNNHDGHLRIDVIDASPTPPKLPDPGEDAFVADVLAECGRGLALVARASNTWGVTLNDDGKVVWFEPATAIAEDNGAVPILDDLRHPS